MQVKDVKEGMEATYLGEDEDNSHKQGECTAGVVKPEHSRSKKPPGVTAPQEQHKANN